MDTWEWIASQKDYGRTLPKYKILALRIYSQSTISVVLNSFCNQIIDFEQLTYYMGSFYDDDLLMKYINLKDLKDKRLKWKVDKFDGIEYPSLKGIYDRYITDENKEEKKIFYAFIFNVIISLIQDLIEIIEDAPKLTTEMKVVRGTSHYYFSKESDVMLNYAFVSTSLSRNIAEYFTGSECCLFNITLPIGTPVIYVSMLKDLEYHESELLLPPFSKFRLQKELKRSLVVKKFTANNILTYDVIYEGSEKEYYPLFEKYKDFLLTLYFPNDKQIKSADDIRDMLMEYPMNLTNNLFTTINKAGLYTAEIANVMINKKVNIELEYILWSIQNDHDYYTVIGLINNFREFGDVTKLNKIVKECMKNEKLGESVIKFLNLYYKKYMDEMDKSFKVKMVNWFSKMF